MIILLQVNRSKGRRSRVTGCRAVIQKYRKVFWTGARETRKVLADIKKELEADGYGIVAAEAQKQVDALESEQDKETSLNKTGVM